MEQVLIPRLNGPESGMIHANFTFTNRAEIVVMGMHSEFQSGVATREGIATAMVSGDGYTNKDLGGYAESYIGTDSAILAAPGNTGDQLWDDTLIAPLVKAQTAGSLLRLFRKKSDRSIIDNSKLCTYQYCGLYRIVDRWRCREQFSEPQADRPIIGTRKVCFVRLERVSGQDALVPVELNPRDPRRKQQLDSTINGLQGKSSPGTPEHCANCYLDGDGRNDYFECDGCQERLGIANELPQPCRTHKCSERPVKCVHTVRFHICPECIDEGDEAEAAMDDTSWCCALCADFYKVWGTQTRTNRGLFLKTDRLNAARGQPVGAIAGLLAGVLEVPPAPKTSGLMSREQKKTVVSNESSDDDDDHFNNEAGPSNYKILGKKVRRRQEEREEEVESMEEESEEDVGQASMPPDRSNKRKRKRSGETKSKRRARLQREQAHNERAGGQEKREAGHIHEQLERGLIANTDRAQNEELLETEVSEDDIAGSSKKGADHHNQQQAAEDLMLDKVLRALYNRPELDRDLVRRYVPLFLKLSGEVRTTIGERLLVFAAEPSVRSLRSFIRGVVARHQ